LFLKEDNKNMNVNSMNKTRSELIQQILIYMQVSTIEPREKLGWTLMMPSMTIEQLTELEDILREDVQGLADLYLSEKFGND